MAGIRADRKAGKPRATAPRGNRLAGWAQLKADAEKKAEGARLPPARGACTPVGAAGAPPTTALPDRGSWRIGKTDAGARQGQRGRRTRTAGQTKRTSMKPQNDSAKECSSSRQMRKAAAMPEGRGHAPKRGEKAHTTEKRWIIRKPGGAHDGQEVATERGRKLDGRGKRRKRQETSCHTYADG